MEYVVQGTLPAFLLDADVIDMAMTRTGLGHVHAYSHEQVRYAMQGPPRLEGRKASSCPKVASAYLAYRTFALTSSLLSRDSKSICCELYGQSQTILRATMSSS